MVETYGPEGHTSQDDTVFFSSHYFDVHYEFLVSINQSVEVSWSDKRGHACMYPAAILGRHRKRKPNQVAVYMHVVVKLVHACSFIFPSGIVSRCRTSIGRRMSFLNLNLIFGMN